MHTLANKELTEDKGLMRTTQFTVARAHNFTTATIDLLMSIQTLYRRTELAAHFMSKLNIVPGISYS